MLQEAERSASTTQETLQTSVKQFDNDLSQRLAAVRNELDTKSTATIDESTRVLRDLSENCERTVQAQFQTLVTSATDQASQELKERTERISQQCSAELEDYTRSHLDFISESIAEIAKKKPVRPRE
jgi:site-specific DNA-adenine methylase